jgi:two-component system sensor histidine kinase AlgZ
MRSIIKQNSISATLPDVRNLGAILRILVAVNAAAALYAFARASSILGFVTEWTQVTAVVEPYLFLVLTVLWGVSPWVLRQPFATGVALVALVTVTAGVVQFAVFRTFEGESSGTLLRWLAFALLTAGALVYYFHLRARALSPAITEARLQALQARIRPHFLFNSINAVLSLVRSEPKRAEIALQDMADLFRVLMRDNRALAPLADEVELCRQYLELEQLRLGERLQVEWNVKSMPGDAMVPPLVLQPLIENAVYHGIEPSSAPGIVSINVFLTRREVHAILKNPYRAEGGRHHSGNKMALANVRERLALHFDAEASLDSRVTKEGYEVHIRMPYRTADMNASSSRGAPARNGQTVEGRRSDGATLNVRSRASPHSAPILIGDARA